MDRVTEHLFAFLKDCMANYHIEVKRGDINFLAPQIITYYRALTIPVVTDMRGNLEQKILYSLWGLCVDDCIDGGGDGQHLLMDTLGVISQLPLGKEVTPQTPAGLVMRELVERILSAKTCNADVGREFFFLDVLDQVKGFAYEQIIHKRKEMAALFEFEEHSAMTKDHRICLDIDLCTTEKALSFFTIKKFRESFKFLGLALTYQGDVVTFESEFFEEKGLNSVSILGIENSLLPPNVLDLESSQKRTIFKKVIPYLLDEIRMRSMRYRDLTIKQLKEIEEVDTSSLERAIIHVIDHEFPGAGLERKVTMV